MRDINRPSSAPGTTPQATSYQITLMRDIFRALIAGYGAKKLGGGCISTIIIFIILYWLLGHLF